MSHMYNVRQTVYSNIKHLIYSATILQGTQPFSEEGGKQIEGLLVTLAIHNAFKKDEAKISNTTLYCAAHRR